MTVGEVKHVYRVMILVAVAVTGFCGYVGPLDPSGVWRTIYFIVGATAAIVGIFVLLMYLTYVVASHKAGLEDEERSPGT